MPVSKTSLWTGIAYALAIVLGIANGFWGTDALYDFADFTSTIFIRLFKLISIPVIAISIIATLAQCGQTSESGRIFRRTIFYTLLTTMLSATVAALLFLLIAPETVAVGEIANVANLGQQSYWDHVQTVVPDNFLAPFLSANVLSVLIVAAVIGLAIASLPRGSREQEVLMAFFSGAQQVLFVLVKWILAVLPVGIFGFITELVLEIRVGVELGGLGQYFATILSANFIQMLIILPLLLLIRGHNPLRVARGMMKALTVAFFSKSSAGTLPVTMTCAENNLNVKPQVSRFVLPLCTTINMNGCAAFIFVTVIYLMQNAGVEITIWTMASWIFIATVAAVGNAGVPMGCFFLSASLLAGMNIPIQLMGVILPFYAVIDMIETTLNVWSDSTVAVMVDKDMDEPSFD